ncbi:MAG: hypothetical protein M5R40_08395 [Anaerolineae bacterium]|nr:hypothetical protein [Anaerolineae bacterium]
MQDALGSVRGVVDESLNMLESRLYAPYGVPFGVQGAPQTVHGFTSEPTDANELVYLRARYLNPGLGVFASLDPLEGFSRTSQSLNRYGYVRGNVVNLIDRSGLQSCPNGDPVCEVLEFLREHPEVIEQARAYC